MNKWKFLKTKAEYEVALKRTIEIFHALQGTSDGDELDILLPLIKEYEDLHFPIPEPAKEDS